MCRSFRPIVARSWRITTCWSSVRPLGTSENCRTIWALKLPELDTVNFTGRKVALYGCGDQYGYSNSFVDALGIIAEKIVPRGASIVGWWPDGEYEYEFSRGAFDKVFMGLPVDNDNQPDQTEQRVVNWTYWILEEFGLMTEEELQTAAAA